MAKRRMFSLDIIDSDAFLDMPQSAQNLYFHLGMRADDDGFIGPKKVMRMLGSQEDDIKILVAKRYVLPFESGVVVIKHWPLNNYIQKDRYSETKYLKEKNQLTHNEWGAYTEVTKINHSVAASTTANGEETPPDREMYTERIQDGYTGKVRLGKVSINTNVEVQKNIRLIFEQYIRLFDKNPNQYRLTESRKAKLKLRLKQNGYEQLEQAIRFCSETPFYRGDNDRGWQADLDFIIRSQEQVEKLADQASSEVNKKVNLKEYV